MATRNEEKQMSVRVLASRNEKAIRDGFQQAVENSREAVILAELSKEIAVGDIAAAEAATRPDMFKNELTSVTNGQRDAYKAGADQAYKELPKGVQKTGTTINLLAPAAQETLTVEGARLVTQVTESNRQAIVEILDDVITRGVPPLRAAKNVRQVIGLNSVQAGALIKQREQMEAAGKTISQIESALERRSKKMIRSRANTIARTESIRAVGQGRQRMWDQLVEDDVIPAQAQKRWITSNDELVGEDHDDMMGETVGINEEFYIPETGQSVSVPNESRPNCRCTSVIVFP